MKTVSLLIPCYNEQQSLPALYDALRQLMERNSRYAWEVIMVNDGSTDGTLDVIKQLRSRDSRIAYIDLSRNFGKENAMLAGFDYASGDCLVVMDADLQHPPQVVDQMFEQWEQGYDDVYARRTQRGKESWLRRKLSLLFYQLLQRSARFDVLQNVGDFRLLSRRCIDALKQLREQERYTKGMYAWIGFKKKEILFEQHDRTTGQSTWRFSSLLNLAVNGITSFTTAPLRISTLLGMVVSLVAFVYMFFVLFKTLIYGESVQGYPTLILVILFLGGVQLLSLGIIGEYLGRIFNETKHRPVYLVQEVQMDTHPDSLTPSQNMNKKIIIAIDGYSSTGKSTMAKALARNIGYGYVDTGAMYRAVTLYALQNGIISDGNIDEAALQRALPSIVITFAPDEQGHNCTFLNGTNVEAEIRSMEVSNMVSPIAAIGFVRRDMVRQQQAMGVDKGIVMDGRDIGTVVFPHAEMKVFVTASAEVRAQRRYDELRGKGDTTITLEEVLQNVTERDRIDTTREESPLRQADDAVVLDNSHMTIAEQDQWLLDLYRQRAGISEK